MNFGQQQNKFGGSGTGFNNQASFSFAQQNQQSRLQFNPVGGNQTFGSNQATNSNTFSSGGMFNKPSTNTFGSNNLNTQSSVNMSTGVVQQSQKEVKWNAYYADPKLFSIGVKHQPVQITVEGGGQNSSNLYLKFHTFAIQGKEASKHLMNSKEMMRVMDRIGNQRGQPQDNPEYAAQQVFSQNQQQYIFLNKVSVNQPNFNQPQQQPGSFNSFSNTFNASQNKPQGLTFGQQNTTQQQSTGVFNQPRINTFQTAQSSTGFNGFNKPFTSQTTGMFQVNNNFSTSGQQPAFGQQKPTFGFAQSTQPQQQMQFGNQQQSLQGGQQQPMMFQPQQPVFGQQQQTQPMFSQQMTLQTQPIFGQQQTLQQPTFGQQPQQQFGQTQMFSQQPLYQSVSNFTSNPPSQPGLFGQSIPATAGLFGAKPIQPMQPLLINNNGGLVGQLPPIGSGLFGLPALFEDNQRPEVRYGSTIPPGGLFGNGTSSPVKAPQASSGLFGTDPAIQDLAQYGQSPQNERSLFGAREYYPQVRDFQALSENMLIRQMEDPVDLELQRLKQKCEQEKKMKDKLLQQSEEEDNRFSSALNIHGYGTYNFNSYYDEVQEEEEMQKQEYKEQMKSRRYGQNVDQHRLRQQQTLKKIFNATDGYKNSTPSVMRQVLEPERSESLFDAPKHSYIRERSLDLKPEPVHQAQVITSYPNDLIVVQMIKEGDYHFVYPIKINKERSVENLANKVSDFIKEKGIDIKDDSLMLIYRSAPLKIQNSLKEAGITENCDVIVHFTTNEQQSEAPISASNKFLPTKPKEGYQTVPDFEELIGKSEEQLRNLPKFEISNQYGRIEFFPQPGKGLDLTNVDLARDFTIEKRKINVYETKNLALNEKKPEVFTKLNVPSIVTLFNVEPKDKKTFEQQEQALKDVIKKQSVKYSQGGDQRQAEHISYDPNSFEWVFKVPHFSEWGDEDESMPVVSPPKLEPAKKQIKFAYEKQSPATVPQVKKSFFNDGKPEFLDSRMESSSKRLKTSINEPSFGAQVIHLKQPEIKKVPFRTKRMAFKQEVLDSIAKKKEKAAVLNQSETIRPTNLQTLQSASLLAIPSSIQQCSMTGVRPVFRPIQAGQGVQLLTFHTQPARKHADDTATQMSLKLNTIKRLETKEPDLSNAILKHHTISSYLQLQEDFSLPNLFTEHFQNMVPTLVIEASPKAILNFLYDVAAEYAKSEMSNEFATVCILNALFGDPRVHLVQMHPFFEKQGGHNNLKKTYNVAQNLPFQDVKQSFETMKIRRNAVTEVFRFICMQANNFKPRTSYSQSDSTGLFNDALSLIVSGNLIGAARLLNSNGKQQVSLLLSQSISSSETHKSTIRNVLSSDQHLNNLPLQEMLTLVNLTETETAAFEKFIQQRKVKTWQEAFVCFCLYIHRPQNTLAQIVEAFSKSKQCTGLTQVQGAEDVKFTLLKLYASILEQESSAKKLQDFRSLFISEKGSSIQMQWIIHYVIRIYSRFEAETRAINSSIKFEPTGTIQNLNYDTIVSNMINHAVQLKRFNLASLMCLLISNPTFKVSLTFNLMSILEGVYNDKPINEQAEMAKFLFDTIKMPKGFIYSHQAYRQVQLRNYENAIDLYLRVKDFNSAHRVFVNQLAKFYFTSPQRVEMCFSCEDGKYVCELLNLLETKKELIYNWVTNGHVLREFLFSVVKPFLKERLSNQLQQSSKSLSAVLANFAKLMSSNSLHHEVEAAIIEQLLVMESLIKCQLLQRTSNLSDLEKCLTEAYVTDCQNKEAVRRALKDNQLSIILLQQ